MRTLAIAVLTALIGLIASVTHKSHAADIDGAWLSDSANCQRVFAKKGRQVSFAKGGRLLGNGFIVQGNQIRGRIARCSIKARRERGDIVNLIAVCSTDIAIDTIQFRLRVETPDKLVREFPDMPEMQITYQRCVM